MKELEDKYIELIINKCTNFENTKSILINYPKENRKFVKKLIQELMIRGIKDIALEEDDPEYLHKLLEQDEETIKNSPYLNNPVWTEYAKKNANFLMLKSEYPHYMDDLDMKKKIKKFCCIRTSFGTHFLKSQKTQKNNNSHNIQMHIKYQ